MLLMASHFVSISAILMYRSFIVPSSLSVMPMPCISPLNRSGLSRQPFTHSPVCSLMCPWALEMNQLNSLLLRLKRAVIVSSYQPCPSSFFFCSMLSITASTYCTSFW